MDYTSFALVIVNVVGYIHYINSATIQCTINCAKTNTGPSSSLSLGGGGRMSTPIIGAPPDSTGPNKPPLSSPSDLSGPQRRLKPSKVRKAPPLPPHIRACLEGRGRNCGKYARLNTEANRKRFLIGNRARVGKKTKFRFRQSPSNKNKKIFSKRKEATYSFIPMPELKLEASKSITDSITAIVDSMVTELDKDTSKSNKQISSTGTINAENNVYAISGKKGKKSQRKSKTSDLNLKIVSSASSSGRKTEEYDRTDSKSGKLDDSRGKSFSDTSFSESRSSLSGDERKDRKRGSSSYIKSTMRDSSVGTGALNALMKSIRTPSMSAISAAGTSKNANVMPVISRSSKHDSNKRKKSSQGKQSVSGILSGSTKFSDSAPVLSRMGLISPVNKKKPSRKRTSSKVGHTTGKGQFFGMKQTSVKGKHTAMGITAGRGTMSGIQTTSGMGKTSGIRQISKLGTDLAMVVSPAIGKLSDVIQSAQMGATTGVTQISGTGGATSDTRTTSGIGRISGRGAKSINKQISGKVMTSGTGKTSGIGSASGMKKTLGTEKMSGKWETPGTKGMLETKPTSALHDGSTTGKQKSSTRSQHVSYTMSGMGTSETKPFSDMRGTIAGTQKSVDNSLYGTATGSRQLSIPQSGDDTMSGIGRTSKPRIALGMNGGSIAGTHKVVVNSLQGLQGISAGSNQVSYTVSSSSTATTDKDRHLDSHNEDGSRGLNQDIEIEINKIEVSKPDMQDKVEKKSNEDGSRGLNQDDSGGKNQDQDSKGASLRNNQMSSSSYSTSSSDTSGISGMNQASGQLINNAGSSTAYRQVAQGTASMMGALKFPVGSISRTSTGGSMMSGNVRSSTNGPVKGGLSMKNMGMNHMDKQINTQSKSTSGTTGTGMQSSPPLRTTLSRQNRVQQSSNQLNIINQFRPNIQLQKPVRRMKPRQSSALSELMASVPKKKAISKSPIPQFLDLNLPSKLSSRPIQTSAGLSKNSGTKPLSLDTPLKTQVTFQSDVGKPCECAQGSAPKAPQIIQATAKLALVGDRSVLIAKVPRAKVIDTNGKGSFHLEFPNLIIQPTLTETITSPSELFGMNMGKGAESSSDSDILVVAMLPKGFSPSSNMFKISDTKAPMAMPVDQSADTSKSIPVTSTKTTSKSTKDQKGIDSTVSESKPKYEVSVETSKDDGKLKVKITADKMKDSTISAIRDKIEKIKTNDNLSIDTSKDDGKLKIKIKADISKDLIVPVFKETVQEPSIKTDISVNKDDGKTKTVKAAQQATGALSIIDTTNVQSQSVTVPVKPKVSQIQSIKPQLQHVKDLKSTLSALKSTLPDLKSTLPAFKSTLPAIKSKSPSSIKTESKTTFKVPDVVTVLTSAKQGVTTIHSGIADVKPVAKLAEPETTFKQPRKDTTFKIEKSKDDEKVEYKIKTVSGKDDGQIKSEIKITIDKSGSISDRTEKTASQKAQPVVEVKQFTGTSSKTVTDRVDTGKTTRTFKQEEDGDQYKKYVTKEAGHRMKLEEDGKSTISSKASIVSKISNNRKIAEAIKALKALQMSQSSKQVLVRKQQVKPTLPDTKYKLPSDGGTLNVLSEKLTRHIKGATVALRKVSTDNDEAKARRQNRQRAPSIYKPPIKIPIPKPALVAPVKKTPKLEALCLIYLGAFIDSIGYAPFPGKCHKLVQCFYLGGKLKAVIRDCPAGMFWDQTMLLCRPPDDVLCFEDRCLIPGVRHHGRNGGCNCFYKCIDGISVPSCCPKGYRYDDDGECVLAFGSLVCDDECETPSILKRQLSQTSCPSLPDPMNIYGYLAPQYGGLRIRACPAGTLYSEAQCRCRTNNNVGSMRKQYRQCSAEFKVNFDNGFKDISKGGLAFDHSHIYLRKGKAIFGGKSKMYIWGFQSKYLGKTFAIRFRAKISRGAGRYKPEPIISNCGPNGDASVEVMVYRGKLVFKAKTTDNPNAVYFKEDYDEEKWIDVTYYYDGNHFGGSCNGRTFKQRTGGNLEIRDNPITIGLCTGQTGFHGEIDELEIYTACIPKDL